MEFLKANFSSLALCVMEILVGILLLIDPVGFTSGIIVAIGILLFAMGVVRLVQYFSAPPAMGAAGQRLFRGLLCMFAGLFCMFRAKWFIATFPVLTILYGILILASGLFKAQFAVDLVRFGQGSWGWPAFGAALTIVFALLILMDPFSSTLVLWVFIGVTLIAEAAIDIVSLAVTYSRNRKRRR